MISTPGIYAYQKTIRQAAHTPSKASSPYDERRPSNAQYTPAKSVAANGSCDITTAAVTSVFFALELFMPLFSRKAFGFLT